MLNKKDLTHRVKQQLSAKYKIQEIEEIIDTIFSTIADAVSNGEDISVSNFGKFFARFIKGKRIQRTGIQWMQDKEFIIKDRFHLGFKPSSILNKNINLSLNQKLVISK